MAARASLKKRGRREGKERGVKMSFLEGVGKAFKDVFGEREERCW